MTILLIGATGRVGRHLVNQLVERDANIRVLTRDPALKWFRVTCLTSTRFVPPSPA
jgi:uncharacterized protein YbjT (DUF2867 family)